MSFLNIPAELRIKIYNHIYAEYKDLKIHLFSADSTKVEFRRKTSDELRTAHSLNRVCRLIYQETKRQFFHLYASVKHEVSLITKADKDVLIAFHRAISGEGLMEEDPKDFLELPRPPLLLTYLKIRIYIYSQYWLLLYDIWSAFPVLERLELDISIPYTNRRSCLMGEFHSLQAAQSAWMEDTAGIYRYNIWHVFHLKLAEVRMVHMKLWNLKYKRYAFDSEITSPTWDHRVAVDDDGQAVLVFNPLRTP